MGSQEHLAKGIEQYIIVERRHIISMEALDRCRPAAAGALFQQNHVTGSNEPCACDDPP
jgi:hypothetical protein